MSPPDKPVQAPLAVEDPPPDWARTCAYLGIELSHADALRLVWSCHRPKVLA